MNTYKSLFTQRMHYTLLYSFILFYDFSELFWSVLRLTRKSCSIALPRDRGWSCLSPHSLCPTDMEQEPANPCRHGACLASSLKGFLLTQVRGRARTSQAAFSQHGRKSHGHFYQPQNTLPEVEGQTNQEFCNRKHLSQKTLTKQMSQKK